MGFNLLKSEIKNHYPKYPVKFRSKAANESLTLSKVIEQKVPELYDGSYYYVNPFLASGHSQTAYTALSKFENVDLVNYRRRLITVEVETYKVPNGEELNYDHWKGESTFAIDYVVPKSYNDDTLDHEAFKPKSQINELPPRTFYLDPAKEDGLLADETKPLLIALHGLSGGSYESYIRAFLHKVTEDPYNFDALVLNARGCANHTITTPQLFNGLWTNDLRYLINEHIRKKWPNKRIYLIGFSLGGAITANYLAQESDDVYHNIKGAVVVGSPWDFVDSSFYLNESYLGRLVYSPTMCQNLLKLLEKFYSTNLEFHSVIENYKENPDKYSLKYLKDFDNTFTSRLAGFNSADEYYRHASPIQRLLKVRVPTVMLSSLDDPVIGSRTMPYSECELNPYLALITTSIGGHLGYFSFSGSRWYPDPLSKLLKELDENWKLDDVDPQNLPSKLDKIWKYDRLV
ncbi:uncharacterized protein PRCAT00004406001 [Priceomyces carsonii]|uniref:uncharacterized protein n=1 Tax=Priceomyces carsonii TaxID=28549 RepID=UPI002ED973DE|nr:unnamed protein product [Priceomyces carsonii]